MSKIYYQEDCNLSMLDGQTIAIIGYGSQGHAHALNLKESGCNVIVGLYEGSRSWKRAQEQGFEVYTAAEAAKRDRKRSCRVVTAIGLLMFFSALGINKGFTTLLLAHIMFCTPYVILSVSPKLRSLDPNLADAALDLGATPLQALTKVIVPQIMPGIVSGALIAFTMSFDDFIISYFVTGNGVNNISILVYTMSKRVNPSINALSTLVIAIITVVLIVVNVVPIIKEKRRKKV